MTFCGGHAIAHGDVLATLRELPDNEFDALLCDPPYGYGNHQPTVTELLAYLQGAEVDTGGDFMGHDWHVPSVTLWREALRVLKPGGALLSFGGARTGWLIALGLCASGFELRDELCWLYASGYPKTANVAWLIDKAAGILRKSSAPAVTPLAKQYEGRGTALKPAREPIYLARKALDGGIAKTVEQYGTGSLDIDACRYGQGDDKTPAPTTRVASEPWFTTSSDDLGGDDEKGWWPAHVAVDDAAAAIIGEKARFFFSAKVSTKEREWGCETLPMRSPGAMTGGRKEGSVGLTNPRAGAGRGKGAHNHHPTLKPIALARWLASMVKPPTDGQLLIPFSGAGSEMIGALEAGWPSVFGIEQDQDFIDIAHARIAAWSQGGP